MPKYDTAIAASATYTAGRMWHIAAAPIGRLKAPANTIGLPPVQDATQPIFALVERRLADPGGIGPSPASI